MPAPRPAGIDKLKRVFSGITLTTNDLTTIAARATEVGPTVAMKANAYRITDIDELSQVLAEDIVLDRLTLMVFDLDGSALEFTWESSYVLIQADCTAPGVRPSFEAIVDLLESRPRNGFNYNVIEVSPPGTWTAPAALAAATPPAASASAPTSRSGPYATASSGMLSRWWKRLSRPTDRKNPEMRP
ncbi:MAG: hypothetical protein H0V44_08350 [Planctomycetes bacterium]|nr:hypothetical protein [Planctomycetota bacterium]